MSSVTKPAIYPGTFDPITFGHLDIIYRASKIFSKIVVAIAIDTGKTSLFSIEERVSIAEKEIKRLSLENVDVVAFSGLLVSFAESIGSMVIVRGLRALSDFEYEFQMSYMNYKLNSSIETVFLPSTEHGHYISSSFVKQIAKLGGNLEGFVSDDVARALKAKYKE